MIRILLLGLLAFTASGCATIFSDYQSAALAGVGNVEFTPAFSVISLVNDGTSEHAQNNLGGEIAVGIHRILDFRVGYARIDQDGGGINVIGGGPKIGLDSNKVAFYIPVGFGFSDGIRAGDTWEMHPTLLFTEKVRRPV